MSMAGFIISGEGMDSKEVVLSRLKLMAIRMRKNALAMALHAGALGAHIAPGLSIIEICAVLYGAVMRLDPKNPQWEERDRFFLSKGHGSLGYYTALAEAGFFSHEDLMTFEVPESFLTGQPGMFMDKGIEISSGSLGLGLSIGVGTALAGKKSKRQYRTFVLMGDGECNEGTVWEAAMAAANFGLDNLIAIIDANGMQSDGPCKAILDMGSVELKWQSFGWHAISVDGHSVDALYDAFTAPSISGKPSVIIASTVKGKGISFMENNNEWHHNRLTPAQYEAAMKELSE
jgi:transketolase